MERFSLERGGISLGVITRGLWDGNQGSWPNWGRLEPSAAFATSGNLLIEECRLHDEAVRVEQTGGDATQQWSEAERLQVEFMQPGVTLVSLTDGTRMTLEEFHLEAGLVYWR